jgi:hypothetical protein
MTIVVTNVFETVAPAPITLLQTGALVSQGATTLAANSYSLLTQESDLTPLLAAPLAIASLAWSSGTVLATTSVAIPGLSTGDKFVTRIGGATPSAYNGLVLATVTGASTFTYPLATNPGAETVPGTYTPPGQGELLSMVDSYFAEGFNQAVYVLELGAGDASTGPTALGDWIVANPIGPGQFSFISYLVPRSWDGASNYLALVAQYEAPTKMISFFTTTTINTYSSGYTAQMSDVFAAVEAPGIPLTEFSLAADFQRSLAYNPSSSNRMSPFANAFLFGATPYPQLNNNALLTTLRTANINYVGTGAEGGISTALITPGKMLDGNDFTYRYSVNWTQLNGAQALANEVINGAQGGPNPLWYDQNGIDRLQDRLVGVMESAVSFNLAQGAVLRTALDGPTFQANLDAGLYENSCVVNAVPWITYLEENPSHYKAGIYNGLTVVQLVKRGFQQIFFNLTVTDLVTQ